MPNFYFDTENNGHKNFELPGAKPHYNPDRPGQVEHIFLDLSLDIHNQICCGVCHIRLAPVRNGIKRLTLDAVNLNIQFVKVDESPVKFEYDGENLSIQLTEPSKINQPLLIGSPTQSKNPKGEFILSNLINTTLINQYKSGLKEKTKIPAFGFLVSTTQDNYQLRKFAFVSQNP